MTDLENLKTPVIIHHGDEIIVSGVRYRKVEKSEPKNLYQFLGEYKYGISENFPYFDDDEFSIFDWSQIFVDYIYEYGDVLSENSEEITVKFNKTQLEIPSK